MTIYSLDVRVFFIDETNKHDKVSVTKSLFYEYKKWVGALCFDPHSQRLLLNKAEVDVSLKLSCFFHDPVNAGNLISGSSAFAKTSLNIWEFTVHYCWSLAWMANKWPINIWERGSVSQVIREVQVKTTVRHHITLPAAASRQSCPTRCDPTDGSPPGSPAPGILQARTLEWVAISFSNAWTWKVKGKSLSCPTLCDPMDRSLPGSSVHGIFQARALEWGDIAFSVTPPRVIKNKRSDNNKCWQGGGEIGTLMCCWRECNLV